MFSDLIVMSFGSEAAALRAKRALEQMHYSAFLGVVSTLVVTRDAAGKVVVHEQRELPAHLPDASEQMPRVLVEAFFGQPPGDGQQKLVDVGLDEVFVRGVVSALGPKSSMILNYIWRGSLVDAQLVLDALRQFKGTLYHTTVPDDVGAIQLHEAGIALVVRQRQRVDRKNPRRPDQAEALGERVARLRVVDDLLDRPTVGHEVHMPRDRLVVETTAARQGQGQQEGKCERGSMHPVTLARGPGIPAG